MRQTQRSKHIIQPGYIYFLLPLNGYCYDVKRHHYHLKLSYMGMVSNVVFMGDILNLISSRFIYIDKNGSSLCDEVRAELKYQPFPRQGRHFVHYLFCLTQP